MKIEIELNHEKKAKSESEMEAVRQQETALWPVDHHRRNKSRVVSVGGLAGPLKRLRFPPIRKPIESAGIERKNRAALLFFHLQT